MNRSLRFVPLALALALASTGLATAQPPQPPPEADARFKEGMELAKKGDYERARRAFLQAYALYPSPNTLFNLAFTEAKAGMSVDGMRHLRELTHTEKFDPQDARYKAALEKMRGQTLEVEVVAPAGADIYVDGTRWREPAPLKDVVDVSGGEHVVEAKLGEKKASAKVSGKIGERKTVTLELPADPVPAPTPTPAPTAAPTTSATFTPPPPPPPESSSTRWIVAGGLAAGAAVGVGVGVGFGIASKGASDDVASLQRANPGGCANRQSAVCQDVSSRRDDASRDKTLAIVGYVAGGALGAGALLVAFWPKSRSAGLRLQPGPSGATMVLDGRF